MRKVNGKGNTNSVSIVCLAASAAFLFSASIVAAEDYAAWQNSKRFYLNTTSLGANVTNNVSNFPVLIRLTSANFSSGFPQCLANGADVRFEQSGTVLSYEIEQWDASGQAAAIWVKVPMVYGNNGSQYITMHWGNSSVSSESSSAAVFETSNGYSAVYHLTEEQSGTGTAGVYKDATSNGHDGTDNINATGREGTIGYGHQFNGNDDNIYCGTFDPAATTITLSAWVKWSGTNGHHQVIFAKRSSWSSTGMRWQLHYAYDRSSLLFYSYGNEANFNTMVAQGQWSYVTLTSTNNGTAKLYINGTQVGGDKTIPWNSKTDADIRIGRTDVSGETWNGSMDEAVIASTIRSSDWIKLCYQNQKSSQALVSEQIVATMVLTNDGRGTTQVVSGVTQAIGTVNAIVAATPWPGYKFVRWSVFGSIDSVTLGDATQPTTTVVIKNAASTIMANFEATDPNVAAAYPNFCGAGDSMKVDGSLKVGAGLTDQNATSMTVTGRVKCDGMYIQNWLFKQKAPDYVFGKKYSLLDLEKVEKYIKENGHLPEVPSAAEMQKQGIEITEFNMMLLKKIEELTLYTIDMKKQLEITEKRLKELK